MKKKLFPVFFVLVLTVVCLLQTPGAYAEDIIVISNRSVPVTELSASEIKQIYLGKKKMWPNGIKVIFTKLDKGDISEEFLKKYVRKSESMYDMYWKKQVFTGGGRPPATFKKQKDLVDYVESTKGAIGYVTSQAYTDRVKILAVSH